MTAAAAAAPGGRSKAFGDFLHRRQLPLSQFLRGVLRLFQVQQGAHGDAEQSAHGDELIQLGHGGIRLPFAHRLPGHSQFVPQFLLRETGGFSERLYLFS